MVSYNMYLQYICCRYRYTDIQIYRYTDIQIYRYTDTQIYRYTNIHIYKYSSTAGSHLFHSDLESVLSEAADFSFHSALAR